MRNEKAQHQEPQKGVIPVPSQPPEPSEKPEEQKEVLEAWQSTRLLDSFVGPNTDKRKKLEIVEIIHFHRLALREHKDAPERKRLAAQNTMRKIRRILPHVPDDKLQPLLNATVEQLTPSGYLPVSTLPVTEQPVLPPEP